MQVFSWSRLEPALRLRAGWRRVGREWHGPCPVRNVGKDTAWVREADFIPDGVLLGCRKCSPMSPSDARAHVEALAPDAVVAREHAGQPSVVSAPLSPAQDVDRVWRAAGSADRTPAATYLRKLRACWGVQPFPPSVRWLSSRSWAFAHVHPAPPSGAAGLVVYGYRGVGDRMVAAVQVEALDQAGHRIPWPPAGAPRVSLAGSRFDSGRQRFEVLDSASRSLFLVEGPLSALAAPALFPELATGWTVVGVAGWAGFRRQAVGAARVVRVCPDGDPDGQRAVQRFVDDLVASGMEVWVDPVPPGVDLLDLYRTGGPLGPPERVLPDTERYAPPVEDVFLDAP